MTGERARTELHRRLEEVLGPGHTDALMAHLPPFGWGDVATKDDLHTLRSATRQDFDAFRSVMQAEWRGFRAVMNLEGEIFRAGVRHEFKTFRSEMRGEFDTFKADMRGEFGTFRSEMRGEFAAFRQDMHHELAAIEERQRTYTAEALARTTRTIVLTVVFALVGTMLTTASMFLALG